MQESVTLVIIIAYVIVATWLSLYGFNAIALSMLYLRHRKDKVVLEPLTEAPNVTVQLPVYNERYVVERVIDAVAAFDWPRDKLHVQVLDDSTDETTGLARARAEFHRARRVDITVLHRTDRTGYKAGALQAGLACSNSPFVAVFDADFIPSPDFLRRMIPGFIGRPDVGWVQARWTHLNENYSALTQALALLTNSHFMIEQLARNRAGLPIIFNGSAGIWRRECIETSGGWQHDTLTEDADLSYRAQIAGWKGLVLTDVTVPAELPVQIAALKQQYFRWAKGGTQTLRKLFLPLMRSRLTFWQKLSGLFFLGAYLGHPLMILFLVTWLPIILHPDWLSGFPMAVLGIASLGLPLEFTLAQTAIHGRDVRRLIYFPLLSIIGSGMALNSTRAVIEALSGRPSEFMRTPKFRIEGTSETWRRSAYVMPADPTAFGEVLIVGYAAFMIVTAWRVGNYNAIPLLLLYATGFTYVAIGSAMRARPGGRRSTVRLKADA
jgi:cellulose synthase/poly-beta-1,6-N-acetylglucosamine synthase-like glycosyltransferase